jgi:hypothetical protein
MLAAAPLLVALAASFLAVPAPGAPLTDPLRFFEGRTESKGTVRVFMRKSYQTRSVGQGRIEPDGSLSLVQQVKDEGKPPRERRWRIRQVGPHRFVGTMSEASGPVTIDDVEGRYRFRFKIKGNMSVEQWLDPLDGGMAARNSMTVRKFGMTVGTGEGMIQKLAKR